jgi:hypothetical protein
MNKLMKSSIVLTIASALLLCPLAAQAAPLLRRAPELTPIWRLLDGARTYRDGFEDRRPSQTGVPPIGKDFPTIIAAYQAPVPAFGRTPRDLILDALNQFGVATFVPALFTEATAGVQESFNELMTGQLLLGNAALERGLRTRFPRAGDGPAPPSIEDVRRAVMAYDVALGSVLDSLRLNPAGLRVRGVVDPQFPFFVENSVPAETPTAPAEIVESELRRATELLQRRALATNELASRTFESSFADPSTGATTRAQAANLVKQSAQTTYLNAVLLHLAQGMADYELNNGFLLTQRYSAAEQLFDTVMSGDNPLRKGTFIPSETPDAFLSSCSNAINSAITSEKDARDFARDFDMNQTALRDALFRQRQDFGRRIELISGLPLARFPDLTSNDPMRRIAERDRLVAEADQGAQAGLATNNGDLAKQSDRIQQARVAFKRASEIVNQFPEKIRIEEERAGKTVSIQLDFGERRAEFVLIGEFSKVLASGFSTPDNISSTFGFFIAQLFAIDAAIAAANVEFLRAVENARLTEVNNQATIKQLLLDQVIAAIDAESAAVDIAAQTRIFEDLRAELVQTASALAESNDNLAAAFFADPGSRILRDATVVLADLDFDVALRECFEAARALEFVFSEPYSNVVLSRAPTTSKNVATGTAFPNAESVFAATSANIGVGSVRQFLRALDEWDKILRETGRRGPSPGGPDDGKTFSIKKDILGFKRVGAVPLMGEDEFNNLRFRDFLRRQRVFVANPSVADLMLEFPIDIASPTEAMLLNNRDPNVKIMSLRINLLGAGIVPSDALNPPRILVQLAGTAFTRPLEGGPAVNPPPLARSLDSFGSNAFTARVRPRLVELAVTFPGSDNTELVGQSPFVSRFLLRIDTSLSQNAQIDFDKITDIEIEVKSRFGLPPPINFPL